MKKEGYKMKTKNVVFAGFSALAVILSPVVSSVAPVVAPVYAITQAPSTLATPNGVLILVRVVLQSQFSQIMAKA